MGIPANLEAAELVALLVPVEVPPPEVVVEALELEVKVEPLESVEVIAPTLCIPTPPAVVKNEGVWISGILTPGILLMAEIKVLMPLMAALSLWMLTGSCMVVKRELSNSV